MSGDSTIDGMEFLHGLFGTILFAVLAVLAAGVILTLVSAILGWSLYQARRRLDRLTARASNLAATLASMRGSSHRHATPQLEGEVETGGDPGRSGPVRTDARRSFRIGDHPVLAVVLAIALFGILFGGILIPFLLLAALPVVPVVLGVLRYRVHRQILALTARITALETGLAAGNPASTPRAAELPSVSASTERANTTPVEKTEELAETYQDPGPTDPPVTDRLHSFLFGGNTLTRVGIILLFFGFAFFLNYAVDQGWFSIELRLSIAAAAGLILLTVGWRLREFRREYALALQGGGAGIAYLTAFAAVNFYDVIGAGVGLGAMLVLVAVTGVLALKQDAPGLALLSSMGGFLGPVLVTRDAGHVVLFSYYGILDAGIAAVAWFRAWRLLSLLGFVFTFLVGAWWGAAFYLPEHFATTQPFLALFLAIFVAVPVLHAWRQPPRLGGFVDATLVFGVPLAASILQYRLASGFENGPAVSALVFCGFYAAVAGVVRSLERESLGPLVESFTALSVIFGTLAFALAVDEYWISVPLALEGAALVWIGTRRDRRLLLLSGLALQFLAGFIEIGGHSSRAFAVLDLGHVAVTLSGLVSAWFLHRRGAAGADSRLVSVLALVWGLLWWYGTGVNEISRQLSSVDQDCAILGFVAISGIAFALLRTRLGWKDLAYPPLLLFPAMVFLAIDWIFTTPHFLAGWGALAWPAAVLIQYWLLWRCETEWSTATPWIHCGTLWFGLFLAWWEAVWLSGQIAPDDARWPFVMWALVPAYFLWAIMTFLKFFSWPIDRFRQIYLGVGQIPLVIAVSVWVLVAAFHPGAPDPQGYIPLLNPIEFVQVGCLGVLFQWSVADPGRRASAIRWPALGCISFVALNGILARMSCRFLELPFEATALLSSGAFQVILSVVWTTTALVIMLVATRLKRRPAWKVGVALLVATVIKLLLFDLADTGTLTRIVSFIVVGGLILVLGYFSPLPPKDAESKSD